MIDENITEINRLNKLIEALVTIADIQETEDIQINNIGEEINYILDEFKSIITEKNIQIKYIQKQNFVISSDREYLYILLSNIIKNAIKFSVKSGVIHISYMDNECVIQDFGCGIDTENISNIFYRFFQEKDARN
jgi:signal transduction histidine kinase